MPFGGKSKRNQDRLVLWDAQESVLFDGRIWALRFEEVRVIELSMEFYADPAPCEIHRSAVIQRGMMEIEQALLSGRKMCVKELSQRIQSFFGCYQGLDQLQFFKKESL